MKRTLYTSLLLGLAACEGPSNGVPPVQDSATANPSTIVSVNRVVSGEFESFAPACVARRYVIDAEARTVDRSPRGQELRPGQTVEFQNFLPDVPTNVTSVSFDDAPLPMFSPNLVAPYNIKTVGTQQVSFWRFTLAKPGIYEYFDTNTGEPGRKVVDSYYGTTTFVGESDAPKGVICVDEPGCTASFDCLVGNGENCCICPGVCCDADADCGPGKACSDARCVDRASLE